MIVHLENCRAKRRIYGRLSDLLGWLATIVAEICHNEPVNKQTVGVAMRGDVPRKNAGGLVDGLGSVGLPNLETICAVSVVQMFEGEGIRYRRRDI